MHDSWMYPKVLNSYDYVWGRRRREEEGRGLFWGAVVFDSVGMENTQRKDDFRIFSLGMSSIVKPSSSSDPPWI